MSKRNPVWIVNIMFRLDDAGNDDRLFGIDDLSNLDKLVKDHADCGTIVNIVVMANEFAPVHVRKKLLQGRPHK
jgi:hypothetical protein